MECHSAPCTRHVLSHHFTNQVYLPGSACLPALNHLSVFCAVMLGWKSAKCKSHCPLTLVPCRFPPTGGSRGRLQCPPAKAPHHICTWAGPASPRSEPQSERTSSKAPRCPHQSSVGPALQVAASAVTSPVPSKFPSPLQASPTYFPNSLHQTLLK